VTVEAGGPAFIDLHTHSTASDGTLPPEQVIEAAAACGLKALALTDHDTIGGIPAAREAGERLGIRVITGVELSAFRMATKFTYWRSTSPNSTRFTKRLEDLRASRFSRAEKIVEKLNELGIPITLDEVLQQSNGGAVGRPHIARALIARGVCARLPRCIHEIPWRQRQRVRSEGEAFLSRMRSQSPTMRALSRYGLIPETEAAGRSWSRWSPLGSTASRSGIPVTQAKISSDFRL